MPSSPRVVLGMALLLAAAGCGQAKAAVDRVRDLVQRGDEAEAEVPADEAPAPEAEGLAVSAAAHEPVAAAMVAASPRVDAVAPTHAPDPDDEAPTIEPEALEHDDGNAIESSPQTDAACLAGTWAIVDADAWVRKQVAKHSLGHRLRARSPKGAFTLDIALDGDASGTLVASARHRKYRYTTTLAGHEIAYAAEIHGEIEAAWTIATAGRVRIDAASRGWLTSRLEVEVAGKPAEPRDLVFPKHGTFELACAGDDLFLTPTVDGRPGEPIAWRRVAAKS